MPGFTRHFTTISVDLPGHGQTQAPTDPARHGHEQVTTDLASLMAHLGLHRFHLLGYSMGGRMALALALAQPQRLRALVLESASPGLADAGNAPPDACRMSHLPATSSWQGCATSLHTGSSYPCLQVNDNCQQKYEGWCGNNDLRTAHADLPAVCEGQERAPRPATGHSCHNLKLQHYC